MMKQIVYLMIVCVLVAMVPMVAAVEIDTIDTAGISPNSPDLVFSETTLVPESTITYISHFEDSLNISSDLVSSNSANADVDTIFDASTVVNYNVPQYSQRDSAWKDDRLGYASNPNPGTIGNYGCALTSTAMVFKYYGVDVTPKSLNNWLISNNGFTNYDLINWQRAADFSDNILGFEPQDYTNKPADLNKINSELDAGRPVIAHVNLYNSNALSGTHFVVITGYEDNNVYILALLKPY
ncbi:C39 family peptidase [Methanogenium cariaci]|jgi:peptidase C39-like protein